MDLNSFEEDVDNHPPFPRVNNSFPQVDFQGVGAPPTVDSIVSRPLTYVYPAEIKSETKVFYVHADLPLNKSPLILNPLILCRHSPLDP